MYVDIYIYVYNSLECTKLDHIVLEVVQLVMWLYLKIEYICRNPIIFSLHYFPHAIAIAGA